MTRIRFQKTSVVLLAAVIISALSVGAFAQEKKPGFPQRPAVNSPEVLEDGRVVLECVLEFPLTPPRQA